jgi:hypothetical protein
MELISRSPIQTAVSHEATTLPIPTHGTMCDQCPGLQATELGPEWRLFTKIKVYKSPDTELGCGGQESKGTAPVQTLEPSSTCPQASEF